jgi:hypothetical protein
MNVELEQNNYLYVPNFLTAQEADNLAQAFFIAQRDGYLVKDDQVPAAQAGYNILPCVKTLVKMLPQVSELCGEDVLPTYTYGRIYGKGDVLGRHSDRDACEISLTVTLQKDETDWPIWIQKPNGEQIGLNLNVGDAMVYLGCTAEHWREAYQGTIQTQAFFHYVCANGDRAIEYFDNRNKNGIY